MLWEVTPAIRDEPLTFFAECINLGDEATGEFVARFELDNQDQFEAPISNVAPMPARCERLHRCIRPRGGWIVGRASSDDALAICGAPSARVPIHPG